MNGTEVGTVKDGGPRVEVAGGLCELKNERLERILRESIARQRRRALARVVSRGEKGAA
ncbi:MAG: hypothetical protein H5T74_08415 [Actinobacteria bacterium]|nr:hypothetical protein [Actinomycetota bacterium]